ncbi:MAG: hypothetical protein FJW39_09045 [Acidobacteria bacterium]|nr:hypothetical protein [Acidobacteriota bacterium]
MFETMVAKGTPQLLADAAVVEEQPASAATLPDVLSRSAVRTTFASHDPFVPRVIIWHRGSGTEAKRRVRPSFEKSVDAVVALLRLPPGWNSYSAKPVSRECAEEAIRLLDELLEFNTPLPSVVPTVRGGIQLEWHTGGVNIEVYVNSSQDVSFFAERLDSDQFIESPLTGSEEVLKAWVKLTSGKVK